MEFRGTGDSLALITAIAFGIAAAALGFYLRHLSGFLRIPTGDAGLAVKSKSRALPRNFLRPAEPEPEVQIESPYAVVSGKNNHRLWEWIASLTQREISVTRKNGHDVEESEE